MLVLADCPSLEVLVLPDSNRFFRHRLDKWGVPRETQIILYSDLKIACLFAELAEEMTSPERKQELRREILERISRTKRRNRRRSSKAVSENLLSAVDAIGEQLVSAEEVPQEIEQTFTEE